MILAERGSPEDVVKEAEFWPTLTSLRPSVTCLYSLFPLHKAPHHMAQGLSWDRAVKDPKLGPLNLLSI